jgi:HAD superfamily hydrolase (TIGR01458 family)
MAHGSASATLPPSVRGLLLDLDGTLYVGSQAIPGAPEALRRIKAAGYPLRFITNTSTLSRVALCQKLRDLGFEAEPEDIFSAPWAARCHLERLDGASCALLLAEDARREFAGLPETEIEQADCLVLGDFEAAWSHALLNRLFNRMRQGAQLVALHKNRFWQTEAGLSMDMGGLVAALEYCSGQPALVLGKPSPDFFLSAVRDLGLNPGATAILGDDIDSDIGGGQAAGLVGLLARTGKYREDYARASQVQPDAVLNSVQDLPDWLGIPA